MYPRLVGTANRLGISMIAEHGHPPKAGPPPSHAPSRTRTCGGHNTHDPLGSEIVLWLGVQPRAEVGDPPQGPRAQGADLLGAQAVVAEVLVVPPFSASEAVAQVVDTELVSVVVGGAQKASLRMSPAIATGTAFRARSPTPVTLSSWRTSCARTCTPTGRCPTTPTSAGLSPSWLAQQDSLWNRQQPAPHRDRHLLPGRREGRRRGQRHHQGSLRP